jgi:hypothetical protein
MACHTMLRPFNALAFNRQVSNMLLIYCLQNPLEACLVEILAPNASAVSSGTSSNHCSFLNSPDIPSTYISA